MSGRSIRIASLVALLVGCEKAGPQPPPAPLEPAPAPLTIRYSADTELSTAGTNDNSFLVDEDEALFILTDADVAGGPTDSAKRMTEDVAQRFREPCPSATESGSQTDELHLTCALRETAAALIADHAGTVSFAVAVVRALVAARGDVAIVSVRAGRATVIPSPAAAPGTAAPPTFWLDVEPNETLALVNKDLLGAIGLPGIQRWAAGPFEDKNALEAAMKAMVDAKSLPDHGPLAVVLFNFVKK
ncbi:MAG: hypothetical protein JWP01_3432 [Myxococcales bacterium]|nr:hypothetical protein [Myxococcales bacterium]